MRKITIILSLAATLLVLCGTAWAWKVTVINTTEHKAQISVFVGKLGVEAAWDSPKTLQPGETAYWFTQGWCPYELRGSLIGVGTINRVTCWGTPYRYNTVSVSCCMNIKFKVVGTSFVKE